MQAAEIQPFYDCVVHCQLQDMRCRGANYTWTNHQDPPHRICAKLDRTLINGNWLQLFPEAETWGLQEGISDHCPLLVNLSLKTQLAPRHFKYCNMWALHPHFRSLVLSAWNSGKSRNRLQLYNVLSKLKLVKQALRNLNRAHFNAIVDKAKLARSTLLHTQS